MSCGIHTTCFATKLLGDRGVLVDFYVDFAGEGGDGVVDSREPWLFWPGGWHAKNG
jgi:hypothetical protein